MPGLRNCRSQESLFSPDTDLEESGCEYGKLNLSIDVT